MQAAADFRCKPHWHQIWSGVVTIIYNSGPSPKTLNKKRTNISRKAWQSVCSYVPWARKFPPAPTSAIQQVQRLLGLLRRTLCAGKLNHSRRFKNWYRLQANPTSPQEVPSIIWDPAPRYDYGVPVQVQPPNLSSSNGPSSSVKPVDRKCPAELESFLQQRLIPRAGTPPPAVGALVNVLLGSQIIRPGFKNWYRL